MESSCKEILPENFIYRLIYNNNNDLILKFNENKLRQEILDNPRKKFCPYPDCNSYARRNNKKDNIVKCENGHKFCFYCLKKPHKRKKCKKELDEKMEEFAKKKFIKKCPNCKIWSEKISGCNHMTCIECGYQWCWLCNEKYDETHYKKGKCKGFQFFKPKNEKDIQLAFEGKIKIRTDESMSDYDDNSFGNFNNPFRRNPTNPPLRFGLKAKIGMSFLFLFFGNILTIICESGQYLEEIGRNRGRVKKFFYNLYFISIIILGFIFFFFQIFINIINFILIIIVNCIDNDTTDYFNAFYSMLKKIKKLKVMHDYIGFDNNYILKIIFKVNAFAISLFFGIFFLIIKFIDYKNFFDFLNNKQRLRNFIMLSYTFILFLLIISMYPFSILLNIIGIIEEIIRVDYSKIIYNIESVIRILFY